MKCPNCQVKMESEHSYVMRHEFGKLVEQTPSCEYLCPECGSEYRWIKGKTLETRYDSMARE